jgi:ribosome-associated protein
LGLFIHLWFGIMKAEVDLAEVPITDAPTWLTAVRAAESKKAYDVRVLDLREVTSFTDYFVICSGANPRLIQAISDAVGEELAKRGERPLNVEGYDNAEWVLADYGDLIIHVFSDRAREFYDLERLWRHARSVEIPFSETVT